MKNQKKYIIIGVFVIAIIIVGLIILNHNKNVNITKDNGQNNKGLTNSNILPASTGPEGFKIAQAIVENNEDPVTKKAVSDHLEIALANIIDKDISNITVDYLIENTKTNKNESYHAILNDFILKSKETQTIHFDNGNGTNHFWVNKYSMYYISQDPLKFTITVSAEGYKTQTVQVNKDAGGAEQAD
jgi:hypothetical protein